MPPVRPPIWTTAAASTTSPTRDEDVRQLPDPDLADGHEDLGVLGLGQHEVERPLADVPHQALHVRLDDRSDQAAHQHVDAHDREQLRLRPAGERRGLPEHEGEDRQARPDRDQRLDQLGDEVGAVLELVQGADPEVQPEQRKRPHG
jgi:hypothetical protein